MSLIVVYLICCAIMLPRFLFSLIDWGTHNYDFSGYPLKRELSTLIFAPIFILRFLVRGMFYSITLDEDYLK